MKEEKFFFGGMNQDDTILQEGDYLDASCCLNAKSTSNLKGSIANIKGNTFYEPSGFRAVAGSNKVIKAIPYEELNAIIYFVYNNGRDAYPTL